MAGLPGHAALPCIVCEVSDMGFERINGDCFKRITIVGNRRVTGVTASAECGDGARDDRMVTSR
jgi:hypothetical protein